MKQISPFLFLLLFLFVHFSSFSQLDKDKAPKFGLGVSYGWSIPTGDFDFDGIISGDHLGYGESGVQFELLGRYYFDTPFSLLVKFRYQDISPDIFPAVRASFINDPSRSFGLRASNNWEIYYLFAGVGYNIPIVNRVNLTPTLSAGPLWVTSPGIYATADESSDLLTMDRNSGSGTGIAIELGAELQIGLTNRLFLVPFASYSQGFASVSDIRTVFGNGTFSTSDYDARIVLYNFGGGIMYRF